MNAKQAKAFARLKAENARAPLLKFDNCVVVGSAFRETWVIFDDGSVEGPYREIVPEKSP